MAKLVKSAQGYCAEAKGGGQTPSHRLLGVARALAKQAVSKPPVKPEPEGPGIDPVPKPKRKRKSTATK